MALVFPERQVSLLAELEGIRGWRREEHIRSSHYGDLEAGLSGETRGRGDCFGGSNLLGA